MALRNSDTPSVAAGLSPAQPSSMARCESLMACRSAAGGE
jgi:hypothetical protein